MTRRLLAGALLVVLTGCGSTPPAPGEAPAAAPTVVAAADAPIVNPVKVDIPALEVTDEVVPVGLAADRSMEIPAVDEVGFYKLGVVPGEIGPSVLAGHVNWDGVPGSFADIGQLKPGDDITVTGADGAQLTFDVYETRQFAKAAFDTQFVFGDRAAAELVLVTCSGAVVNHSYTDNTAVAARLVQP